MFIVDIGQVYLEWALCLTEAERRERDQLLARLPDLVVDAHVHVTDTGSVRTLSEYALAQARSSFPAWPIEESDGVRHFLYGDRRVRRLLMAHPYRGIDHRRANRYLLDSAGPDDRVLLCGLPDDERYTVEELASGRYVGLKMYPHYREPPYERLAEYFPDWSLQAAATAGVPAIVHLPLPIADCLPDLLDLIDRHPDNRIVLAHLGRQHHADDAAVAAFTAAAAAPLVTVDTSMAAEAEVHGLALDTFGPHRVLYGSDEPFNLLRYVGYEHPRLGYRLIAPRRYHWLGTADFERYRQLAVDACLLHLQVLRAIVDNVDQRYEARAPDVLRGIFAENAAAHFAR